MIGRVNTALFSALNVNIFKKKVLNNLKFWATKCVGLKKIFNSLKEILSHLLKENFLKFA